MMIMPEEKKYTLAEVNDIAKHVRDTERYIAWTTMADIGIPAERIPKIYRDAQMNVLNAVMNSPVPHVSKASKTEESPATPAEDHE